MITVVLAAVSAGIVWVFKKYGEAEREQSAREAAEHKAEAKRKEAEIFREPRGDKSSVIDRL